MPRPRFTPTAEHRRLVKSMAAMGIPHEQIGRKISIRSPKTLRKYFRDELNQGSTEATYNVAQSLYKMATDGNATAAIFWLKTRGKWKEQPTLDPVMVASPPFVVAIDKGGPEL